MKLPRGLLQLAARQRQRVSPDLLRTVIEVASLLPTGHPCTVLPRVRRAVVIAPHPDDETLGCGGTIARLATAGTQVTVALVTDGAATVGASGTRVATGQRRRAEAARACHHLGASVVTPLGFPDSAVDEHLEELSEALAGMLQVIGPDLVLLPWPLDAHRDHRAVAAALSKVPAQPGCDLWGYEVHTPIARPDRVIDVTEVSAAVTAALAAHVTAAAAFDLTAVRGLARYRSLATTAGTGQAEAFVSLRWSELSAWVAAGEVSG
ncbi:MAG: PIG-L deacetylase family protein [Nitriliruptoraceae bacterium]